MATDHVIESFRNRLWPAYKTGAGIEPDLLAQFQLLEDALQALGVTVWPMVEWEADDALAAAAMQAAADPAVERVVICTPDKDLAQCVRGERVVQLNRRTNTIIDEAGVVKKFGVAPGLDSRLPRARRRRGRRLSRPARLGSQIGGSSPGAVRPAGGHPGGLARVARQREEPRGPGVDARSASGTARGCSGIWPRCAPTSRLFGSVEDLRWTGPTERFAPLAARLEPPR